MLNRKSDYEKADPAGEKRKTEAVAVLRISLKMLQNYYIFDLKPGKYMI